ncbi:MAG: ABC transporter ATP-binding protein [Planctomycetota bacterium]|nr:ABC transporter ATP-binding protein [Planctomycetota bacterium]
MSSSDIAISVRGVGKSYTIARNQEQHITLAETMLARLKDPFKRQERETFWALKDVSFDIKKGDVVGIIGRNGAGKSTLLKILSRITEPTRGEIDVYGRVGSLLEVGTGFHPELTGRENIFLNGAILGMSKAEIRKQFDAIVDFAGVEKFLDTPVKRYSSGMYVRLAFAVAAHLNPDILIVDEVLAVGDTSFQKKCLGKMGEVAQAGRTVFFVSHNMSVIQTLCRRCVMLCAGELVACTTVREAIQMYLDDAGGRAEFVRERNANGDPTLTRASIAYVDSANEAEVTLNLDISSGIRAKLSIDVRLSDASGVAVGFASVGALDYSELIDVVPGRREITLALDTSRLAIGTYRVGLDLTIPNVRMFDRVDNAVSFDIVRAPESGVQRVVSQRWGYGSYEMSIRIASPVPIG